MVGWIYALYLFVGCGASVAQATFDPYESNPRGAPPVTLDEFCSARAANCVALRACLAIPPTSCEGDVRQRCLDDARGKQKAGSTFDPKAAGVCAAYEHTRDVTYCGVGVKEADPSASTACGTFLSHGGGVGAPCDPSAADCAFDSASNVLCLDGHCQHLPYAGLGETCTLYLYGVDCGLGLTCSAPPGSTTSTCVPRATEGQSCVDVECAQGLSCDHRSNVCVRPLPAGAACDAASPCRNHCRDGTCT